MYVALSSWGERHLKGGDFTDRSRYIRFNAAIHEMTKKEFGVDWNDHEPGTFEQADERRKDANRPRAGAP